MSERNESTLYLLIFSTDENFLIKDAFLIQASRLNMRHIIIGILKVFCRMTQVLCQFFKSRYPITFPLQMLLKL